MRLDISTAEREARLAGFLTRLAPLAALLGLIEAWGGVRFHNRALFDSAAVILTFSGIAIVAARLAGRGRSELACALTVGSLAGTAFAVVWVQPTLYPVLVVVPLLGAALALPYLQGPLLTAHLALAIVAVVAICFLGLALPPTPLPPRAFRLLFDPLAAGTIAAFVGYLLWLYSQRLTARLHDELSRADRLEAVIRELSGRERTARQAALRDPLTGLANRRLFLDRLEEAMGGLRQGSHQVGLLFLDLDGFKRVNDRFGHEAGDRLLVAVTSTLAAAVRSTDTLGRIGGDELALVMPRIDSPGDAEQAARRLLERSRQPVVGSWGEISPSLSIGIAAAPIHARDAAALLRAADLAMYDVKARGGGDFGWIDDQLRLPLGRRRPSSSSETLLVQR